MAKFTLEEKRLQSLRTQLSGSTKLTPIVENHTSTISPEISYMRQDLFKITVLTCLALGIQFGIYIAMVVKIIPTF